MIFDLNHNLGFPFEIIMSTPGPLSTTPLEHIFRSLDWLGLDLDHTLIRYDNAELLPLIYTTLGSLLVKFGGLPPNDDLPSYDRRFCSRGLIFDALTGDVLRLNSSGKVCAARHGYSSDGVLSENDIQQVYENGLWDGHKDLMESWRPKDAFMMATHFDSPAIQLCALMVDYADRQWQEQEQDQGQEQEQEQDQGKEQEQEQEQEHSRYSSILPILFKAFDANFSPPHFSDNTSQYFNAIKKDPHRYVLPRSRLLPSFQRLRDVHGTRVMIITNSAADYAKLLLSTAFKDDDDWSNYFDLIVYDAKKKNGFFGNVNEFVPVSDNGNSGNGEGAQQPEGKEFCGGNIVELHSRFLGGSNVKVAYAGDDVWVREIDIFVLATVKLFVTVNLT